MLYTPGRSAAYDNCLAEVLKASSTEQTPDGFEYFVADPGVAMGLSMGEVVRSPSESEVTLVINGNILPEDRVKIAEITIRGEENLASQRYWLAKALDEVLGWRSDEEFNQNIRTIHLVMDALHAQHSQLQSSGELSPEVKKRLRDEAASALGILAAYNGITNHGLAVYQEFTKQGLWLPSAESDEIELSGSMFTQRGSRRASFKLMDEKSDRHNCASCSAQILKGTTRMTLSMPEHDGYSDHHHYHTPCFLDRILPKFDLSTLEESPLCLG